MQPFLTLLFVLTLCTCGRAQGFTSYYTGDTVNITTQPTGGVCLMGGRTENDEAMRWFLRRADGGDVLVLRASGSDGYNDYLYRDLGVPVNSVETIVFNTGGAAGAAEVMEAISGAEAIWFAGGNQANYVNYWRGTAVDSLIRVAIRDRNIVIGGTSAGMAILGSHYYSALNGGVTSEEALNDPFNEFMTIDTARFLDVPLLDNIITDTHFSERGRQGRFATFIARASVMANRPVTGIACDEYTAVCIDSTGIASVYGTASDNDFAYFVRPGCPGESVAPQTLTAGQPLTWGTSAAPALQVFRLRGDDTNPPTFDLNVFDGTYGDWRGWWISEGVFSSRTAESPACLPVPTTELQPEVSFQLAPNPVHDQLTITATWLFEKVTVLDTSGRIIHQFSISPSSTTTLSVPGLSAGSYYLVVTGPGKRAKQAFIVP